MKLLFTIHLLLGVQSKDSSQLILSWTYRRFVWIWPRNSSIHIRNSTILHFGNILNAPRNPCPIDLVRASQRGTPQAQPTRSASYKQGGGGSYFTLPEFVRTPECNAETDGPFYFWDQAGDLFLAICDVCVYCSAPWATATGCPLTLAVFGPQDDGARNLWISSQFHYRRLLARCVRRKASPASPRAGHCLSWYTRTWG